MKLVWLNDLSARADEALPTVSCLGRLGAEVHLVHALGVGMGVRRGEDQTLSTQRVEATKTERAEAHLTTLVEQLHAEGISATASCQPGQPLAVVEAMHSEGSLDLAVIGRTGIRGLVDRVLVGSNTRRILRGAHPPVLVSCGRPMARLHTILCPVDPEDVHGAGLAWAATLANMAGAHIRFVSVILAGSGNEDPGARKTALEEVITTHITEMPTSFSTEVVVAETAVAAILKVADEVDLVVMATAGRKGVGRLVLGSVAESTVEKCPVPVLVSR